ncbi:hypothetical protein IBX35_04325 [Candidatus Bathyarchaeota archaeon]|nr:hypothetical protein [Candidatus Bathyarchaeota archaeon]
MPYFTRKQRFKIALGGFVSLVGFVVLAFTFLVITKTISVENILQPDLLINVMVIIGGLDVLAGIILLRSR